MRPPGRFWARKATDGDGLTGTQEPSPSRQRDVAPDGRVGCPAATFFQSLGSRLDRANDTGVTLPPVAYRHAGPPVAQRPCTPSQALDPEAIIAVQAAVIAELRAVNRALQPRRNLSAMAAWEPRHPPRCPCRALRGLGRGASVPGRQAAGERSRTEVRRATLTDGRGAGLRGAPACRRDGPALDERGLDAASTRPTSSSATGSGSTSTMPKQGSAWPPAGRACSRSTAWKRSPQPSR
jgi:hypothetical protein